MGHCIDIFANISLEQGDYEASNRFSLQALQLYKESNNPEPAIVSTNTISNNYLSLGQYELALKYASTALEEAKALGIKPQIRASLENLSTIHAAMRDYPQAYHHHVELLAVKDSLLNEEKNRQMAELQTRYETEKKEKEIALLEKQKAGQRFQFIMIGSGLVVVLLIGCLFIAYLRVKIRKNRQLLKKNKQVYETRQALIQAELENAKLKEKELQQALAFKNKELTTHTLNLVQKNNIMEELKSNINTVVKDADGQTAKQLNSLKRLVDHSFRLDKDWEEFKMHFEQVHKDFFTELLHQYPNLTPAEGRLCALIKLNLNTKEMATIMGITPDSVKIARYRLRKKLGLSTENNLTEFIINFDRSIGVYA
jgi:DNA-binding CsgD family transcriptional regulator